MIEPGRQLNFRTGFFRRKAGMSASGQNRTFRLLFYGGVMNLWWIAGLAAYVLFEKLVPGGHWIGRFGGAVLILWGVSVLIV